MTGYILPCEGLRSALDALCLLADFVEQAELGVIQLSGKVDVDLVRVDETSGFLPEGVLFGQALFADVHGLGECVDTGSSSRVPRGRRAPEDAHR